MGYNAMNNKWLFSSTEEPIQYEFFEDGLYKLEAYGAKGSSNGGYARGFKQFSSGDVIVITCGDTGDSSSISFNDSDLILAAGDGGTSSTNNVMCGYTEDSVNDSLGYVILSLVMLINPNNDAGDLSVVEPSSQSANYLLISPSKKSGFSLNHVTLKGYTRLEYIESTGTQYIDVGNVVNLPFSFKFKLTSIPSANGYGIFGSYVSGSNLYYMHVTNSKFAFTFGQSNYMWKASVDTNDHSLFFDGDTYFTDNGVQFSVDKGTTLGTDSCYLFGANGLTNRCSMRVYYATFYNSDQDKILDLIPVIRHEDGAIGMYDLQHQVFYGNNGTGVFIGGPIYVA